ncbi:hypothetical protein [Paramaledivibacter caminithermalis]|jgi:hypothetical protein|uniref:Uncharacterized protein n=1 Tax=Paramaledivibacter caminithermalis (strain DSM 15212 / CIP 107654 / DViRD3) TaxID=1121301 RepID=A0A1M6LP94_PARC5|nr:hypothetical protein [Paramaledivibacter caminithermalis]SHJ72985.1 hypothetical protein SAMN02745912_00876 [Paramaledivibacter caminithermalis DSM 15212]
MKKNTLIIIFLIVAIISTSLIVGASNTVKQQCISLYKKIAYMDAKNSSKSNNSLNFKDMSDKVVKTSNIALPIVDIDENCKIIDLNSKFDFIFENNNIAGLMIYNEEGPILVGGLTEAVSLYSLYNKILNTYDKDIKLSIVQVGSSRSLMVNNEDIWISQLTSQIYEQFKPMTKYSILDVVRKLENGN